MNMIEAKVKIFVEFLRPNEIHSSRSLFIKFLKKKKRNIRNNCFTSTFKSDLYDVTSWSETETYGRPKSDMFKSQAIKYFSRAKK